MEGVSLGDRPSSSCDTSQRFPVRRAASYFRRQQSARYRAVCTRQSSRARDYARGRYTRVTRVFCAHMRADRSNASRSLATFA